MFADVEATDEQKAAWYDVLGQWDQAVHDFENAESTLRAQDPATLTPELQAQRVALLNRASGIRSTIENIMSGVQSAKDWLAEVGGALASPFVKVFQVGESIGSWLRGAIGLNGLAVLPLIPIAVVGAAIATISYFVADYLKYQSQVALTQKYVDMGYTPEQAAAAARGATTTPSIFDGLNKTLMLVGFGVGAFLLYRHSQKRIR